MSAELKQAEAALEAFEAKLLADIGLDLDDGPIDATVSRFRAILILILFPISDARYLCTPVDACHRYI